MKPNKNIDRLFQEKLKDLEVVPPDIVWKNIENSLKKKKERRVFPIWLRIGTAAAVLLLATIAGVNYFSDSSNGNEIIITDVLDNSTNQIIEEANDNSLKSDASEIENTTITSVDNSDVNNTSKEIVTSDNSSENKNSVDATIANNKGNSNIVDSKSDVSKGSKEIELNKSPGVAESTVVAYENEQEKSENKNNFKSEEENQTVAINKNNPTTNPSVETEISSEKKKASVSSIDLNKSKNDDENDIAYENIENLEDTLENKLNEDFKQEESTDITKKWSIASVIAPVYYSSFNGEGSPLDSQFESNSTKGTNSVSYGIKVGYQINKKFTLQSGVTLMNVGYTMGDIYVSPSPQLASRLENVNYQSAQTSINVNSNNTANFSQALRETNSANAIEGQISQEYGYVEVPLELKYRLTNGKFGVHVVGGFSTLFLNSNSVLVETDDFSTNLGEASNLNNVNFSGNLGFDVDYNINKSLFINVAPMIKFHTSTFSENSGNFEPYMLGFYTGLNYRF